MIDWKIRCVTSVKLIKCIGRDVIIYRKRQDQPQHLQLFKKRNSYFDLDMYDSNVLCIYALS